MPSLQTAELFWFLQILKVTCSGNHLTQTLKLGKDSKTVYGEWANEQVSAHKQNRWVGVAINKLRALLEKWHIRDKCFVQLDTTSKGPLKCFISTPRWPQAWILPPTLRAEIGQRIWENTWIKSERLSTQRKDETRWKVKRYKCISIHFEGKTKTDFCNREKLLCVNQGIVNMRAGRPGASALWV